MAGCRVSLISATALALLGFGCLARYRDRTVRQNQSVKRGQINGSVVAFVVGTELKSHKVEVEAVKRMSEYPQMVPSLSNRT